MLYNLSILAHIAIIYLEDTDTLCVMRKSQGASRLNAKVLLDVWKLLFYR